MITSTSSDLDIAVEDIIRGLGPNEITQREISSDDWNDFFIQYDLHHPDDYENDN